MKGKGRGKACPPNASNTSSIRLYAAANASSTSARPPPEPQQPPPIPHASSPRSRRMAARLFTVAISRALLPTGATASGSAPAARRGATTDVLPERAASVSGVQPPFPAADGSAPCRSRSASASTSPALTAAWMQPLSIPISLHPSDGSALCCSSSSARGSWTPPRSSSKSRAMCSAVRLCMSRRFGSAPCLSSSRTISSEGSSYPSAMWSDEQSDCADRISLVPSARVRPHWPDRYSESDSG
mmetsp:Transcript_15977/g.47653  ORF Transcript_15977/g.47653 Transcript_15977/m.47653 type:complete len:243 (-) Transcript_15977:792-1520(-)